MMSEYKVGDYFMPVDGPITSSVKLITIDEKGLRFKKIHHHNNGEEFFINKEAFEKSLWRPIAINTQLLLL
jgi:hypothetical protein